MKLHHVRRGAGEPLLLIQGMSGNLDHWGEPFLSALEADFDVVAFDNRGVGRSPRVEEGFSISDMADDAAAVLDDAGLEDAHVLGISMGGMIAQELALAHPDRLRTLTLGCTYAGGPEGRLTAPEVWERLGAAMSSGDRELAIRTGWEINVSAPFAADDANWKTFRETALGHPAALSVILKQLHAISRHDTSARLAEIIAPTLVVHGTDDQMLGVANGEAIARAIPGARLELLEGVGHMFWLEAPDRVGELLGQHALAGSQARSG